MSAKTFNAMVSFDPRFGIAPIDDQSAVIKSLRVDREINSVCGEWSIDYVPRALAESQTVGSIGAFQQRTVAGASVRIESGEALLMRGYAASLSVSVSTGGTTLACGGRSLACDFVDASCGESHRFKNARLDNVLAFFCAVYGLDFMVAPGVTLESNLSFTTDPCSSGLDNMEAHIRDTGLLLYESSGGVLILGNAGTRRAYDVICEDGDDATEPNLRAAKSLSASYNYDAMYSEYRYLTQSKTPRGQFGSGRALNNDIRLTRRLCERPSTAQSVEYSASLAAWRMAVDRAKALSVTCAVSGMTQSNGKAWALNELVSVRSRSVWGSTGVGYLLIRAIATESNESGATTTLTLCDPESFRKKPLPKKIVNNTGMFIDKAFHAVLAAEKTGAKLQKPTADSDVEAMESGGGE